MPSPLARVARSMKKHFSGNVSRTVLLTRLLPLSVVLFFGTAVAATLLFPNGQSWGVRVISSLTSPENNPQGYWLPSLGIVAAMLLALPFAGYAGQRLHSFAPRLACWARRGFAAGFLLMVLSMAVQPAERFLGLRWLHATLAGISVGIFVGAMLCCCACALRGRFQCFGKQTLLPGPLSFCWVSITLLPFVFIAGLGILMLLGHQLGLVWAEDFRQSFRHTVLWQLAFWEWIGAVMAFGFLAGSVLLLPDLCRVEKPAAHPVPAGTKPPLTPVLRPQRGANPF